MDVFLFEFFERFGHHCFSYRGPTVTAISLANNVTLVLAVDVEWR